CLSSRLPHGVAVTPERLRQVEAAEAVMRALGFREFRVRHHGADARLEIAQDEITRAADLATTLAEAISALGFARVLLDVEGYRRSGSLVMLNAPRNEQQIATLELRPSELARAADFVPQLRQRGFRYITIELQ